MERHTRDQYIHPPIHHSCTHPTTPPTSQEMPGPKNWAILSRLDSHFVVQREIEIQDSERQRNRDSIQTTHQPPINPLPMHTYQRQVDCGAVKGQHEGVGARGGRDALLQSHELGRVAAHHLGAALDAPPEEEDSLESLVLWRERAGERHEERVRL